MRSDAIAPRDVFIARCSSLRLRLMKVRSDDTFTRALNAMLLKKLRLRTLLMSLSIGGVVLTSGLLLGALLFFQKANIEDSLLEGNIAYARKLADTTDRYLATA